MSPLLTLTLTGCLERADLPNISSASTLRAWRRLAAFDTIPAPTSWSRLECDCVSCPETKRNETERERSIWLVRR